MDFMIAIIDYGMGNLRSVQKAFEKVGHQAVVTSDPAQVAAAEKVVLPGVGAFEDAIAELRRLNLVKPVLEAIDSRQAVPGHLPGAATAVRRELRERPARGARRAAAARSSASTCPRDSPCRTWAGTNWPSAGPRRSCRARRGHLRLFRPLLLRRAEGRRASIATETDYGGPFCSMIWRDNVFATQFHPEKSQVGRAADSEELRRTEVVVRISRQLY